METFWICEKDMFRKARRMRKERKKEEGERDKKSKKNREKERLRRERMRIFDCLSAPFLDMSSRM